MQAAQLQRSIGLADVRRGCSQASGNGGLQTQRSAARSARQAQAQTQAQAQAQEQAQEQGHNLFTAAARGDRHAGVVVMRTSQSRVVDRYHAAICNPT